MAIERIEPTGQTAWNPSFLPFLLPPSRRGINSAMPAAATATATAGTKQVLTAKQACTCAYAEFPFLPHAPFSRLDSWAFVLQMPFRSVRSVPTTGLAGRPTYSHLQHARVRVRSVRAHACLGQNRRTDGQR